MERLEGKESYWTPVKLWQLVRAHEWWHYKFPVALGVVFSLAWLESIPFSQLFLPCFLVVASGFVLAIYASVFNDILDMEQDKLAGKVTPMMSLDRWQQWMVLALSLLLNCLVAFSLFNVPNAFFCFVAIWAVYTAYSLPPIRLKEKGFLGVLSIAVGEHLLAGLLSVFIVLELTGFQLPILWFVAVVLWSVSFGCRGIIWHQLADIENDRKSNCKTLGAEIGYKQLKALAEYILFPVEILSFTFILALSNCPLSWLFLLVYAALEVGRSKFMNSNLIIVQPKANDRFVLFEYYQLFFPLSFLFASLASYPVSVFLIALFCLCFAFPIAVSLSHLGPLIRMSLDSGGSRSKAKKESLSKDEVEELLRY